MRSTAQLSPNAAYVMRYGLRPGRYVVTESRTLNAVFSPRRGDNVDLNVRRMSRQLRVRRTPVPVTPASPRARVQGFRAVSPGSGATDGWLTPRARRLLEESGLVAAVPGLNR
jgi:hypothetical protein